MPAKLDSTRDNLLDLVFKDDLTKLYNRRFYNRRYSELIQECKKTDSYLSFLMIDVDHFKSVNDTYGHKKGDEVIITVARTMAEVVKSMGGIPIRYAGDEFCSLLPGIPKMKAQEIGEQVRRAIEGIRIPIEDSPEVITTSLSIGVSNFPVDTDNPEQLQALADEAAYISKKKGRNRVSTVDDQAPQTLDTTTLYRYFPCQIVIGRQDIIEKFGPVINPGRKRKRPLIVLHGLPGVGKTRLLEEIHSVSDSQRCFLIKMQGSPLTLGQPFIEIIEPLSSILSNYPELAARAVNNLRMEQIQVLLPFLPVLSRYTVPTAQDRALNAGQKKEIALEGLKEILLTLSQERPLLMFFDEFHFSNLGTRMLINDLKMDPRSAQIAMFAAVCDVETVKNKDIDLLEMMTRLSKAGVLDKVPLKPLDRNEAGDMMNYIIKDLGEYPDLIDAIHQRTEGNPGKIENLLKKLIFKELIKIENGVLIVEEVTDEDLSDLDWTKINQRSVQVENDVLQLLAKAAVIGMDFQMEVLSKLVNDSENQLYEILEKAERADLIYSTIEGDEEIFHFRGADVKNDLYTLNPEEEQRTLHRKVALAEKELVLGRTEKVLSKLVYHLERAGDHEAAMQYMNELVEEFSGLFSPTQVQMYIGNFPQQNNWGEEQSLDEEDSVNALRVCKRLKIAVNNLDRYPMESEIVRGSFESAYRELARLLEKVELISFTEAEGQLLINGEMISIEDKDEFDQAEFLSFLERVNLKGISFRNGLERDEFLTFLGLLLNITTEQLEKAGSWQEVLNSNGVVNAQVSLQVFVTLSQREMLKAVSGSGRDQKPGGQGYAGGNGQIKVESVSRDFLDKLENFQEKFAGIPDLQSFMDDVQILVKTLSAKEAEVLNLETIVQEYKDTKQTIGSDGKPRISLSRPHRKSVREIIGKSEPSSTHDQSTERQGENSGYPGQVISQGLSLLLVDKIKQDIDVLIYELNYPDIEIAQMAGSALLAKGREVIEPLLEYLINNENVIGRKVALEVLRKLDPMIDRKLLDALVGDTDARQKSIIISIFKDFPDIPLSDVARLLIRDPDPRIRRRFLALLEKMEIPDRTQILVECLKEKNEEIVTDVIFSLGRIRDSGVVPHIAQLVSKKWIFINDRMYESQKAACQVLGQLGGDEALQALIEVLNPKTNPPVLKWKKPPEVRAAAAYALGYFPTADVKPILDEAFDDPSPVVRSAVKTARFMLSGTSKEHL